MKPRLLLLALTALAGIPAGARAQSPEAATEPALILMLPSAARRASEAPEVRAVRMLTDRSTRELLASGFPARLHFKLELWEARFFDKLVTKVEWDVVVRYDPLAKHYTVTRVAGRVTPLGMFAELKDAEDAVARAYVPTIALPGDAKKKYYYFSQLEVEMLSVGDLDEVKRWLEGEAAPATQGKEDPGTAVGRGMKTLFTRILGGQVRRYSTRTAGFRIELPAK